MSQDIKDIRKQFLDIKNILSEATKPDYLHNTEYVARLSEEVEESYFSFNSVISQESSKLQHCVPNRNKLHDVVVLLSELENGAAVTPSTTARLDAFPTEVDEIIAHIDTALNTH